MKLQLLAGFILALLLVLPILAMLAREWSVKKHKDVAVNAATDKTLDTGRANLVAEAAFPTRFLLAARGTASSSIILCTASLPPQGICQDEPVIGDFAAVALLGAAFGTHRVVASKAIAENANVYATAGGKVTDAVVVGAFWVGKTQPGSIALADGDQIVIIPRFPTANP